MFGRKLNGIAEIKKYLGLQENLTVLDWKIGYDLPVKKVGGIWTAKKSELKKWFNQHKDLREAQPEPREVFRLVVEKGRFGLLKTKLIRERK
ncbi:MAG: hypothetical protein KKD92_14050 [Proteobacteria bacterium]|nr:hypothetical protein [Pseudomonadota bacterium]